MRIQIFRFSSFFVALCLFSFLPLFAAEQTDTVSHEGSHELSAEEIVRGERLFFGLVYTGEKSVNCAACHNENVNLSDTVNWNPNAYEISRKYASLDASDLESVLLNPRGARLGEVHDDIDLTTEDVTMIKSYLDVIAEKGLIKEKPVITSLVIFIVLVVLILFSLTDLIITKKVSPKWIHAVIILGAGFFVTKTLVEEAIAIGRSKNYAPTQPIKFSHAIHAGQNQTNCFYCHPSAEYSKSAGIPATNVCMNCHLIVRSGSRSGRWEINKVIQAYENDVPIEWIRVHNNPDHVFFSHAQHVSVGGVECKECHGEVENMDRIRQVSDLSMGWCINCHREKEVDFHSNEFYSNYEILVEKVRKGEIDDVTVEKVGGTECMKCHY